MKKQNNHLNCMVKNVAGCLMFMAACFLLFKSLMFCRGNDIWFDELFSVQFAKMPMGDMLALAAKDVHPPLYYIYLSCICLLCKPICSLFPNLLFEGSFSYVAAAKVASVLPYLFLMGYAVTLVRKQFGILAMGMFSFCIFAMPKMSSYTVEIRMYSLAMFFVTAAFLHAVMIALYGKTVHYIAFFLYSIAAAYTHYFACIAVAVIYILLLFFFLVNSKKNSIKWILMVFASAIGYVPWLMVLLGQVSAVKQNYWIQPVTLRTLAGCLKYIFKPDFENNAVNYMAAILFIIIYFACVLLPVILYAFSMKKAKAEQNDEKTRAGQLVDKFIPMAAACVVVGTVLIGFVVSLIIRPIFVYRYMMPSMGCFWLGMAIGADFLYEQFVGKTKLTEGSDSEQIKEQTGYGSIIGCVISLAVVLFLLILGRRQYNLFMWEENDKLARMETTAEAFAQLDEDAVLVCNFNQVQAILWYYLNQDSYLWGYTDETLIASICDRAPIKMLDDVSQIESLLDEGKQVLFVGSGNARDDVIALWEESGLNVDLEYDSLFMERYWFNIYEVRK